MSSHCHRDRACRYRVYRGAQELGWKLSVVQLESVGVGGVGGGGGAGGGEGSGGNNSTPYSSVPNKLYGFRGRKAPSTLSVCLSVCLSLSL